jgi:tetratricopeptide (TPR) repeat protein
VNSEPPSYTQLVRQAVRSAGRPLTVAEIRVQVERERPIDTKDPAATIRGVLNTDRTIATLGGRPARYTWWPCHLQGCAVRQPLRGSDLLTGTLVVGEEVWQALWPDFDGGASRSAGEVTLFPAGGPAVPTRIAHLVGGQAAWGIDREPALAAWFDRLGAAPLDDLIVRVLDVDRRHYGLTLDRRTMWGDAEQVALVERNLALADAAVEVLRTAYLPAAYFDLIPRLFARDAYRDPLPPDPWDAALRADLRFVVGNLDITLAERVVGSYERDPEVAPDPHASPRPAGRLPKIALQGGTPAPSEETRRAWAAYLFERGMDHLWVGWPQVAEAYYKTALQLDPGHADAWVHVGNRHFEGGHLTTALDCYERGVAAAQARTIGDPETYEAPFWLDLDSRPYMRALHGCGLCLWRMGRVEEARRVLARMLALNPNDNQGVRFTLADLDEGLSWEESMRREKSGGHGG